MSHTETLRKMFQHMQLGGKFQKQEVLALLGIIKDLDDRLEKLERVCMDEATGGIGEDAVQRSS